MFIKDKNNFTETELLWRPKLHRWLFFFLQKKSSTISHFHMCVCFWWRNQSEYKVFRFQPEGAVINKGYTKAVKNKQVWKAVPPSSAGISDFLVNKFQDCRTTILPHTCDNNKTEWDWPQIACRPHCFFICIYPERHFLSYNHTGKHTCICKYSLVSSGKS